jgi:hypothetical protein
LIDNISAGREIAIFPPRAELHQIGGPGESENGWRILPERANALLCLLPGLFMLARENPDALSDELRWTVFH